MHSSRFFLFCSAPVGIGLSYLIYDRLSIIRHAQCFETATAKHIKSRTVALINPFGQCSSQDSYSIRIPVHKLRPGITNEEILARFTYGCFAGWIFTPERLLLRVFKPQITNVSRTINEASGEKDSDNYSALNDDGARPHSPTIWSLSALNRTILPQLGVRLFGLFQLFDRSAASPQEREQMHYFPAPAHKADYAFAEFVAGSDQSVFAVSQRFDVVRQSDGANDETESVIITASHLVCNPLTGKNIFPAPLKLFHGIYARLLFADGIREVMGGKS
ncbi:hypothetical protein F4860DRAFT_461841 [Xylaria cubensis]|nr:hypothetical protein F4860DRAFT_461841 [Xylaria cubensis]